MKTVNDYLSFICTFIDISDFNKKITPGKLVEFDPDYRYISDCEDTFQNIMQGLINNYHLDTFETQLEFIEAHFSKELIKLLFDYYVFNPEAIQYINSKEDMKKVDNYTGYGLVYYYFQDKTAFYRQILLTYDMHFHIKNPWMFIQELNYRDKFYPNENTLPKFFIYTIENIKKYAPTEHLNVFIEKFGLDRLCKDDILKNYFTKHNMAECLEKLEVPENSPRL